MITTMQDAATAAIQVQDACNLTGVLRSFVEAMTVVRQDALAQGRGTDWINTHPVAQLFADKIADLTGRLDMDRYSAAYQACRTLGGQ
jgi:hypothetical protein